MTGYTPVKPTPLVVTETESYRDHPVARQRPARRGQPDRPGQPGRARAIRSWSSSSTSASTGRPASPTARTRACKPTSRRRSAAPNVRISSTASSRAATAPAHAQPGHRGLRQRLGPAQPAGQSRRADAGYPAGGPPTPPPATSTTRWCWSRVGARRLSPRHQHQRLGQLRQDEPRVRPADPVQRRLRLLQGRVRLRLVAWAISALQRGGGTGTPTDDRHLADPAAHLQLAGERRLRDRQRWLPGPRRRRASPPASWTCARLSTATSPWA